MDNKTYLKRRRDERRILAIKILGGKCAVCELKEKLHFDHKDPNVKNFSISTMLAGNWDKVLEELKKCQLLCEDHHKEKNHKEAIERQFGKGRHGTMWRYWKHKCRCDKCKEYKHLHYKKYKKYAKMDDLVKSLL